MHLYFMSRGIWHFRNQFISDMTAQRFPWKRKNLKTGQEETHFVQGALRPIELWEYVFPEESLDEVLTMLNLQNGNQGYWGKGYAKHAVPLLRKSLNAKKVPNLPPSDKLRLIERRAVGIEPIGIKKDERRKWDEMGYEQEML